MATPAERRRDRVAKALGDPFYFGELYVRPYTEGWDEELPPFADEMLAFALSQRRGVIVLPPEFLKTTLLSQVLPLWLTFRYSWAKKMLRGMLLSEEEGMSQANLSVVSWHIENNDDLRADFRDENDRLLVYPDPEETVWREDAIVVARHGASKDPTWQAKGLDSKGIHGRRLDWLIGDDVVTPKNAFSPTYRQNALRLWDMQITTRLVRAGRAIVAGNFNHEKDLPSTLAARKSYAVFRRPAVHKRGDPEAAAELNDPESELLWPSNWDRQRLASEQEDKPNTYRRTYLLDATAAKGDKLKLDWLHVIEADVTPLDECYFLLSLDGAPGSDESDPDFFNITVLASHGWALDLVASVDVRRNPTEQIDLLAAIHDRFQRIGHGVARIFGPKVALDRYLTGAIVAVRPDLASKIKPVSVPGSKTDRLEALGPLAKVGVFRVWDEVLDAHTSDDEDQHQELTFKEEWREFPSGRHDDKLDGLDVGVRGFREYGVEEDEQEIELQVA